MIKYIRKYYSIFNSSRLTLNFTFFNNIEISKVYLREKIQKMRKLIMDYRFGRG